MKGYENGFVQIRPFTMLRRGKHFVQKFRTKEAAWKGTVRVKISEEPWKKLFSGEGRENEILRVTKHDALRHRLKQTISDGCSSSKQGASDTMLRCLRYTHVLIRSVSTTPGQIA